MLGCHVAKRRFKASVDGWCLPARSNPHELPGHAYVCEVRSGTRSSSSVRFDDPAHSRDEEGRQQPSQSNQDPAEPAQRGGRQPPVKRRDQSIQPAQHFAQHFAVTGNQGRGSLPYRGIRVCLPVIVLTKFHQRRNPRRCSSGSGELGMGSTHMTNPAYR